MNEMIKLLILVTSAKWEFVFRSLFDGYQLQLLDSRGLVIDDAVWHSGSYGASEGLLETCGLGGCTGYETAMQVYDGWKQMLAEEEG